MDIKYEIEYSCVCDKKQYFIDYYIPEYNCFIEFYGDYWHLNPSIYEPTYYNKRSKCFAKEQWERDKIRINNIYTTNVNNSIIIIWESTKLTPEFLLKILDEIKNKHLIIYL